MKGAYYNMDDAYKIANYDKVKEENTTLKSNAINLEHDFKKLKRDYEKRLEELKKENKRLRDELYNKNNKQMSLEVK